jgi:hypothetical protein
MSFSYNHLFVAISEQTIQNIISDLEDFIESWNPTYDNYGDKADYEKFLSKVKQFYAVYFLPSTKQLDQGNKEEAWSSVKTLLDKLEKNMKKA